LLIHPIKKSKSRRKSLGRKNDGIFKKQTWVCTRGVLTGGIGGGVLGQRRREEEGVSGCWERGEGVTQKREKWKRREANFPRPKEGLGLDDNAKPL